MITRNIIACIALVLLSFCSRGQSEQDDISGSLQEIPAKYLEKVSDKADAVAQKLDKKSEKALLQMQKLETAMLRKLAKLDSSKAKQVFGNVKERYDRLEQKLSQTGSLKQYIPSLDSLGTSLKFLQHNTQLLSKVKNADQQLSDAMRKVKGLETQFQKAADINEFLKERKQYLRAQLKQLGFAKQLKKLNKKVYYYNEQIAEYKSMLHDQEKIERKVMDLLSKTDLFKEFMKKNSMLSSLFPGQASGSSFTGAQSGFAGLQTRVQVTNYIQQTALRVPNSMSRLQQNIQGAQSQLTELRNALAKIGAGSEADLEMPDFKPNSQKTKSFLKRLEYGMNLQSQKARFYFPVTSDIGFSVGYKLNDNGMVGIGASYKLGLGTGWKNIKLTNQGIGLRSFIDWKIKKNFWLSGGYEMNYRSELQRFMNSSPVGGGWEGASWQQSGLLGISEVLPMKTKMVKKVKFQLLWDFLSYQQVPRTQPVLFRIGYGF